MSLVADYGTSSSSAESETDSDSETDNQKSETTLPTVERERLPGPDFGTTSNSVFSNPYAEAENAKSAILEKHVKMVPTKEDTQLINGKKICWNYRKGRCRFGHKCTFAHDSDLQQQQQQSFANIPKTEENQTIATNISKPVQGNKKKRPGLTQGLLPGKKVMKMFHKQQQQMHR